MSASAPKRWNEFKNKLPVGGSGTGNSHKVSVQQYFGVLVYTDVEGVIQIEQSPNQNDWYVTNQKLVAKDQATRLVDELILEYARFHFHYDTPPQGISSQGTSSQGPSIFKAYTIAKRRK